MYLNYYRLFVCDPILYVKPSITREEVNLSQPEEPPNSSAHTLIAKQRQVCVFEAL